MGSLSILFSVAISIGKRSRRAVYTSASKVLVISVPQFAFCSFSCAKYLLDKLATIEPPVSVMIILN